MSSRLAQSRKEKGEKKREEDESRRREDARRDDYLDFMTKGLKRAFDLDRRRSASPRERQASPRERSPRRPREEESRRAPGPQSGRQDSRITPPPTPTLVIRAP
ncbi:unnamed protein product [Penicillium palitans]